MRLSLYGPDRRLPCCCCRALGLARSNQAHMLVIWVPPYFTQRNLFSCNTLIYCHKSNKRIPTSIIGGKNTIFMQQLSFLLQYRQIYCNARNYLMQHNKFVAISFTTRNHFEFCDNNPYLLQRK